jgi:hypothetical protein
MHSLLPHVWCNPVKSFCSMEVVHQARHCLFVCQKRIWKSIPKLIPTSEVRTRCQVVFSNEHSLHLWERHPCTSTVERQLKDWCKLLRTWCDLHGLLYSPSNIVYLLIQLNCTEMQPWRDIFTRVMWFFNHPVYGECLWLMMCMKGPDSEHNMWLQKFCLGRIFETNQIKTNKIEM